MIYLKLRSNIKMKDDIDLAKKELGSLFGKISTIYSSRYFEKSGIPAKNLRNGGPIGFTCDSLKVSFYRALCSLSFVQEVWVKQSDPVLEDFVHVGQGYKNGSYYMFIPLMASSEILGKTYNGKFSEDNHEQLHRFLGGETVKSHSRYYSAVNYQNSSTQHVHGLHKYKAKFFPRFVRSLIVSHIDKVLESNQGCKTVLDPFVGSGTTLVESSMLGFNSYGLDIDTLSCEISNSKIEMLGLKHEKLMQYIEQIKDLMLLAPTSPAKRLKNRYQFPNIIARKYQRWDALNEQKMHEEQISSILDFIESISDSRLKSFVSICFSDALCKKFNIRMLGTGSGRFALDIAKTELFSLFLSNLKNLTNILFSVASIKKQYSVEPAKSEVHNGSAKSMPFSNGSISLIVTSPPYLPASSGRENYLVGKIIPITALGLVSKSDLESIDSNSVGSVNALNGLDDGSLPKSVYHLIDWLKNDSWRHVKASPILNYYMDLKQSLVESKRVLIKGGMAIYIIGKSSVFYDAKTREILYQAKCDDIFEDLSKSVGFEIIEKVDIELDKKNKNARPRSLDSYYETAFIMKR